MSSGYGSSWEAKQERLEAMTVILHVSPRNVSRGPFGHRFEQHENFRIYYRVDRCTQLRSVCPDILILESGLSQNARATAYNRLAGKLHPAVYDAEPERGYEMGLADGMACENDPSMQPAATPVYDRGVKMYDRPLTFADLQSAVERRTPVFKNANGGQSTSEGWCLGQWGNAMAGETGEACNIIKKIERGDFDLEQGREALAKELADVMAYAAAIANKAGINLGEATRSKFNEVSDRIECDIRL